MPDLAVYATLFAAALLAATVVPMQSEMVLVGLLVAGKQPVWALVAVASCGNIIGSAINWLLGRSMARLADRSWFPVNRRQLDRGRQWYQRYGTWSLLLSWAPVIGDPITVAAGVMGERLAVFVLVVGLAKTARYLVLTCLTLAQMG